MQTIRVDGTPYQYSAQATAGISLATGEKWWGTHVNYRPGTTGRWRHTTIVDCHPSNVEEIEAALAAWIEERE